MDEIIELTKEELKAHIEDLQEEIAGLEGEVDELEETRGPLSAFDAIHALLDLVERPVGSMRAHLPVSAASERALIALYDAVGRTP